MQLFYSSDFRPQDEFFTLSEEESKHCVRVLRMGCGDRFHLTDGRGGLCIVEVVDANPKRCRVKIIECRETPAERPYRLHMAVAPTKNTDRIEWFVEKATEIGVDAIIPLLTEHSERRSLNTDRLEKVAASAMKQSLKTVLPRIDALTPFEKMISVPFAGRKLIAHCDPVLTRLPMGKAVKPGEDVLILIGPEGDFSPGEIAAAVRQGFTGLSLGSSRLRTETAALAAVFGVAFVNEMDRT